MQPETYRVSKAFDDWLSAAVLAETREREELLKRWREAPYALAAHPREEHLLPLMVAAGAGGLDPAEHIFTDAPMQAVISAYRFG
jgi:aromatic ring-opening dioxygenase catalytic subunit (LigB family)